MIQVTPVMQVVTPCYLQLVSGHITQA